MFCSTDSVRKMPDCGTIFGHESEPKRNGIGGVFDVGWPAMDFNRAAFGWGNAETAPRNFGAARADQSAEPDDLALSDIETDVLEYAWQCEFGRP